MKFCIALVTYWQSVGFDTTNWRKSVDGTKAIVHEGYVKVLVPDYETNPNITIYNCPSTELDTLLNSSEWTTPQ